MKNNVFIRSNKSIKTISISRISFMLPLIIYGFYKNGIYLYQNHLTSILGMFKPLVFIFGGAFIGFIINIIYEKLIKKSKEKIIDCAFSSFHIEYGLILGMIVSINTNIIVFFLTTFIMLFISKFFNNRINIICLTFIIIYFISNYLNDYQFLNRYELSKVFHLNVLDYMIGRGSSGIATSHILLIFVALVGLFMTNNNKTHISIVSIVIYASLLCIYSIISHSNFFDIILTNNNIFMLSIVSTDYVTSTYTRNGMFYYALFIAILGFILYFINPVIALPIAILIVSLFNNLIDRKLGYKKES